MDGVTRLGKHMEIVFSMFSSAKSTNNKPTKLPLQPQLCAATGAMPDLR